MWKIILPGFLYFYAHCALAVSADDFVVERLPISDQLTQSTVKCIFQDEPGYLWIGTLGGLNRWDGQELISFNHSPQDSSSLLDGNIQNVFEGGHDNLLITTSAGLVKYLRKTNSFVTLTKANIKRSVINDSLLWMTSEDRGLIKYDLRTSAITFLPHNPNDPSTPSSNSINGIFFDHDGDFWIGYDNIGTEHFSQNQKIAHYTIPRQTADQLDRHAITAITQDHNGLIWIASMFRGCILVDKNSRTMQTVQSHYNIPKLVTENIMSALFFEHDKMWIGTNQGVYLYSFSKDSCIHIWGSDETLKFENVYTVKRFYRDNQGTLWMGTKNGLYRITERQHFQHHSNFIAVEPERQNRVWTFLPEGDSLWFGSDIGLFNWQQQKNTFQLYTPTDAVPMIRDVARADDRFLYVLTLSGKLYYFDCFTHQFTMLLDPSKELGNHTGGYCLVVDQDGSIWLGINGGGLIHYLPDTKKIHQYVYPKSTPPHWVIDVQPDFSNNRLWCATWEHGLWQFDLKTQKFLSANKYLGAVFPDTTITILSLASDTTGTLWIGTSGNGLARYNTETHAVDLFTEKDGLPSNIIYSMVFDDHQKLWLGTNQGLGCFDPTTETCRQFNLNDGLQNKEFNLGAAARTSSGELLFGGNNGFDLIDPNFQFNTHPPKIVLNQLKVFGEIIPTAWREKSPRILTFPYYENFITLNFAVLHFQNPDQNKLYYRIKNIDDQWIDLKQQRDIFLTNIESGNYQLELLAANSDGQRNHEPVSYSIIIKPPFWKTVWFYVLLFLTITGIIFLIFHLRLQQALRIRVRIFKEREITRKELVDDFHDRMGTTFSCLLWDTRDLESSLTTANPQLGEKAHGIAELMNECHADMRQFMDQMDPEKDTLFDLVDQLKKSGEQILGPVFSLHLPDDVSTYNTIKLDMRWRKEIFYIFKECYTNCRKYAEAEKANLNIMVLDDRLHIIFSDNGKGFDTATPSTGRGLANMKKRAEKLGGEVATTSQINKGTTIKFTAHLPD